MDFCLSWRIFVSAWYKIPMLGLRVSTYCKLQFSKNINPLYLRDQLADICIEKNQATQKHPNDGHIHSKLGSLKIWLKQKNIHWSSHTTIEVLHGELPWVCGKIASMVTRQCYWPQYLMSSTLGTPTHSIVTQVHQLHGSWRSFWMARMWGGD